jgi:hypothetical protein
LPVPPASSSEQPCFGRQAATLIVGEANPLCPAGHKGFDFPRANTRSGVVAPDSSIRQGQSIETERIQPLQHRSAAYHSLLARLPFKLFEFPDITGHVGKNMNCSCRRTKQLKEADAPKVKPRRKWGCYHFDDDDGLFCTACYDTKGQKIQTTRLNPNFRQCPASKATLRSG